MRIDAHAHVIVPEALRDAAPGEAWRPRVFWERGAQVVELDGRAIRSARQDFVDADAILAAQDAAGIDRVVLCPWVALLGYDVEPEDGLERCRVQNAGLAGLRAARPERVSVLGAVPLQDPELAAAELEEFARLGGGTVVDVTSSVGLGRDPVALRAIAERTGLCIVMGCGFYCEYSHPETVARASVEELTEFIVREVTEGAIDGVRAGIIGEIGVNGQERGTWRYVGEMTPDEEKALRAAARACLQTGAAVCVHQPNRASAVPEIMRILEEEGAPPERVVLGHMSSVPDFDTHVRALERGYWIAYDNFGMGLLANSWYQPISDEQRIDWLLEVFGLGFGDRVLVSHDVWCKIQLRTYGGGGYGHILRSIVPALRARGLSEDDVHGVLVRNPAELLAF
jgi:phosphotriesterase-related protein